MGLIDRLKVAGEQASSGARESVHEADLRQDLAQAYGDLGRRTFALIENGALTGETLATSSEEIRTLKRQLAALATQRSNQR